MRLTAAQLEQYRRDGFLILPGLFSPAEVQVLKDDLPRLHAEDTPANFREKNGMVRTAMGLHLRSTVYAKVTRHPRLVEPAMQILDDDKLYVQQVKVNIKEAFGGDIWQWHYDFATHRNEDGVAKPLALNLHVFLDDVTVSRRHAEFRRTATGYTVSDVGSLNGTYVNRDRIDEVALQDADEVQIGKYRLVYFASHSGQSA